MAKRELEIVIKMAVVIQLNDSSRKMRIRREEMKTRKTISNEVEQSCFVLQANYYGYSLAFGMMVEIKYLLFLPLFEKMKLCQ